MGVLQPKWQLPSKVFREHLAKYELVKNKFEHHIHIASKCDVNFCEQYLTEVSRSMRNLFITNKKYNRFKDSLLTMSHCATQASHNAFSDCLKSIFVNP